MRDFAKVSPQFWTGRTGKDIRAMGRDCQVLALYLITCPNANMIGLYYLPIPTMAHEIGSPFEGASKALRRLSEGAFCAYDEDSEVVWVREMARFQIGDALHANDKRIEGIRRELDALPKSYLISEFRDRYRRQFHLGEEAPSKPLRSPSQGPSEPLRSQETEKEIEKETQTETQTETSRARPSANGHQQHEQIIRAVAALWEAWRVSVPTSTLEPTLKERMALTDLVRSGVTAEDFGAVVQLLLTSPSLQGLRGLGMLRAKWAELVAWRLEHPGVAFGDSEALKAQAKREAHERFIKAFAEGSPS